MLKKISHIIIAAFILVTTMGMTISKHYCGDNLKSVSLISSPESCCDIPEDCCHNEFTTIKIADDFSAVSYTFDFSQLVVDLPELVEFFQIDVFKDKSSKQVSYIPPPPKIQTVLSRLQTYLF